jgi:hypothetical protein
MKNLIKLKDRHGKLVIVDKDCIYCGHVDPEEEGIFTIYLNGVTDLYVKIANTEENIDAILGVDNKYAEELVNDMLYKFPCMEAPSQPLYNILDPLPYTTGVSRCDSPTSLQDNILKPLYENYSHRDDGLCDCIRCKAKSNEFGWVDNSSILGAPIAPLKKD